MRNNARCEIHSPYVPNDDEEKMRPATAWGWLVRALQRGDGTDPLCESLKARWEYPGSSGFENKAETTRERGGTIVDFPFNLLNNF